MRSMPVYLACAASAIVAACGSGTPADATPPKAPITLLVENNSCAAGRCMTLEVRAFVWGFQIPQNPLGYRPIAEVPAGTHCVTLPDSMSVTLIGPGTGGEVDTTTLVWHPDDPAGIHLVGVDSAAYHGGPATAAQADSITRAVYPYVGGGPSIGQTRIFVPAESEGWRVAFPAVPQNAGEVLTVSRCVV